MAAPDRVCRALVTDGFALLAAGDKIWIPKGKKLTPALSSLMLGGAVLTLLVGALFLVVKVPDPKRA